MMNLKQKAELEKTMCGMIYRIYTVSGIQYHITGYEITDTMLVINTDTKQFNILHANVERMLNMFIEVAEQKTLDITPEAEYINLSPEVRAADENSQDPEPVIIGGQSQITSLGASSEIRNILMDNIRKLQKDKSYIHQAGAINDSVKTLIEFAKTEIQAKELEMKMLGGMRGPKMNLLS